MHSSQRQSFASEKGDIGMKICLFTDTIGDLNGVSRFIQDMAEQSVLHGEELHVISSTAKYCPKMPNIHNIKPRFRIPMPFYKELDLAFPDGKKIREKVKELKPDLIHISSPGAVGYLGLKIAKEMKIPYSGTYHTDFPAYIKDNTGMEFLKRATDKMMGKFYRDFKLLFSRSHEYIDILNRDLNFNKERVKIITPGTNLQKFNAVHKNRDVWDRHGIDKESVIVLYVGRITKEKNVEFLLEVWDELMGEHKRLDVHLVLIGEGSLKSKAEKLADKNVSYLGPVIGEELSTLYASSDFFIFPSVTDTLGQVIMESQASGIPVIVSDEGGPKSLVDRQKPSGLIAAGNDKIEWKEAVMTLIEYRELREEMGENAATIMQNLPIEESFRGFWEGNREIFESNNEH